MNELKERESAYNRSIPFREFASELQEKIVKKMEAEEKSVKVSMK